MSYQHPGQDRPMPPGQGPIVENSQVAMIAYALFLAGFLVPFLPIIALIFAYVNRDSAPAWLATHYTWIIRTFWISIAYTLATGGIVLVCIVKGGEAGIGVGIMLSFALMILLMIWFLVRLIRGLMLLNNRQQVPDPRSWLV